jgi:hypothetical protein
MNPSQAPYFVAVAYAVIVAAVGIFGFQTLPPRFMDLFLVGIAFVTARWSWRPALVLYVLSLVTAAWLLPPRNSLWCRRGMISFVWRCTGLHRLRSSSPLSMRGRVDMTDTRNQFGALSTCRLIDRAVCHQPGPVTMIGPDRQPPLGKPSSLSLRIAVALTGLFGGSSMTRTF